MVLGLQHKDTDFTGPSNYKLIAHSPSSPSQATCAGASLHSLAGTVNLDGRIVLLLRPAKKVAHVSPLLKALPVTALTLTQVTGKPRGATCPGSLHWNWE